MEISFYNQWLNDGSNFKQGVAYYAEHGTNNTLKALFKSGANAYTKKKLDSELQLIANRVVDLKAKINRDELPPHLQIEFDKQGDRIRKIAFLHAQLTIVSTDEERHQVAKKIVNLAADRKASFQHIDHFRETGKELVQKTIVKQTPKEKPQDIAFKTLQLKSELQKLRVQRTKLKSKKNRVADYNIVIDRIVVIETELKILNDVI